MRIIPTAVAALTLAVVAGCSSSSTPAGTTTTSPRPATTAAGQASPGSAADLLARNGLAGKTPEQVVETLDQDPAPRPRPLMASVRGDRVIFTDNGAQVSMPLTGDRFYLSIAPYENRTHECYFHSLATCQGELVNTAMHVKITDAAGAALVDREVTTYANGFVGFWVPTGSAGTITVTKGGKQAQIPYATRADSPTCLTTLRLT